MKTMLFNPYTGTPRHPSDISSDPEGILILDPDAPLRAAQPPAQQGSKPDDETIDPTETCRTCHAPLGKMHMAAGNLKCGWPARVSTSDCDPLDDEKPPAQPERKPTNQQDREGIYLAAEDAIRRDENLSWRSAIVSAVEAFHGIKEAG